MQPFVRMERTTTASETIKAGSINVASAEIFARRGLLKRAREAHRRGVAELAKIMASALGVAPEQAFAVASRNAVRAEHFAAIPLDKEKLDAADADIAGHSEVANTTLVVQREVEALLCEYAESLRVPVRRGVEVTGLTHDKEHVTVYTGAGNVSARCDAPPAPTYK